MIRRRSKALHKNTGFLLALVGVVWAAAGCGSEPVDGGAPAVTPPPSVRAEEVVGVEIVRLNAQQADELAIRTLRITRERSTYALMLPGTVHPGASSFFRAPGSLAAELSASAVSQFTGTNTSAKKRIDLCMRESLLRVELASTRRT